jgi:hypothetical protein
MTRHLIAFLALSFALAGCGSAGEEAAEPESAWSTCRNAIHGFEIDYPRGWHTDSLRTADDCEAFHPEPFELIEGTDCCPWALEAGPAGESFERVVASLEDPMFSRVVSRDDRRVDGRAAVRLELESTGEGLFDRGTLVYAYVIDREPEAFIVQTTALPGEEAYPEWKQVVDKAVVRLRLSAPTP